jgi:hypothetical protein
MIPGKYTAEHIDPEKFEAGLENLKRYQEEVQRTAIEKANAFYAGYAACLNEVSSMLHCANYESEGKITAAYREGADNAFYELCKELGLGCQDIREKKISVDEKAALIAERIMDAFGDKEANHDK